MAKKDNNDAGVNAVQKLVTLGMIAFMGYIFFTQDQNMSGTAVEEVAKPVNVIITDTVSGNQIKSDLRAGKILIGKWEVELAPDAPGDELSIDASEFLSEPNQTPIPEILEE